MKIEIEKLRKIQGIGNKTIERIYEALRLQENPPKREIVNLDTLPIYKAKNIRLINGEALGVMDALIAKGIMVDAIITDPPYGTTACKWDTVIPFDEMWERLHKLIKPNGAIVLFGSEPFSSALRMSNIKNYKYDWYLRKNKTTGFLNAKKQPLRKYEMVSVFYSKQVEYNPQFTTGKNHGSGGAKNKDNTDVYGNQKTLKPKNKTNLYYPNNEIEYKTIKKPQHPTQKPVALMEYLIKTYTNEGKLVLDFTMGSGSTGVACLNTNRRFVGIEKDENYFKIAQKRIKQHLHK